MSDKVTVEQGKPFSESCVWQLQREYFDRQGIEAWADQVPFYVTSNPFIADAYATITMMMISDYIKLHPEAIQHPFYILELGVGTGQFSFYALKKLYALKKALGLEAVKFCYIMSDFTPKVVHFWEKHSALQMYLKEGLLDFAIYQAEEEQPIKLIKQNKTLTPESFFNPLVVIANYVFDTISNNAYGVENGEVVELRTVITTPEENVQRGKVVEWEKLEINFEPHVLQKPYTEDEHLNGVLEEYRTLLGGSSFLIPTGGLRAIQRLQTLSNHKLLLLSSDKGYSSIDSLMNLGYPRLTFHGSFSMMVNYDAMARYFKHAGQECVLQSPRKGIKSVAVAIGLKLSEMKETAIAIQNYIERFSPADYFILHRRISDSYDNCNLDTLASHLALALWDPHIFMRINHRICALVPESDPATIEFLANHMSMIMDNFYDLPSAKNLPFEIGSYFYAIHRYAEALEYYQKAFARTGEQFEVRYNMALCYYHKGEYPIALTNFKRAQALNPASKDAKEWMAHVSTKMG